MGRLGGARTRPSSRGRGGRGRGHYTSLEIGDMDEIPLMGGIPSNEEEEGGEGEEEEEEGMGTGGGARGVVWNGLGGRKRWQQRMRSHSTLLGLVCGGGWKVVLHK